MESFDDPCFELLRLPGRGVTLHARVTGPHDGPLAVLLHGFPETGDAWRDIAPRLADAGLQVLMPDQRGYGASDKPRGAKAYGLGLLAEDIVLAARAMGRERFSVVGHDWGGIVAWHLAACEPGRVERAAILNAPHPDVFGAHAMKHPTQLLRSGYVAFFQVPMLPERVLAAGNFALLRNSMIASARPGALDAALMEHYRAAWAKPGALRAMLDWYRALPASMAMERPRVRVPVRVIWGDKDRFLDQGLAEASVARCEQGEVRHLPEATHWLHHEAPEDVARLLVEWLRG